MRNPFQRRSDGSGQHAADDRFARPDDTAEALRARLAEQALHAPHEGTLAERIIHRAENQYGPSRGRAVTGARWGRFVAVAAAVAVVAGVGVAVAQYDPSPGTTAAEPSTSLAAPPNSTVAPRPTPSRSTSSRSSEPTTSTSDSRVVRVPTLDDVRVLDITFTGGQDGWGLASADCLSGPGRCTALLRTTDGSKVWQSRPNTPFHVAGVDNCSAPCVTNIRFATDDIGYAFGPSALFMTTNGAQSWQKLDGGADALETLDGNVIRVSSDAGGCPPGCDYTVQVADIGSTDFTTVRLPGAQGPGDGVSLARSGSHAYLVDYGNPAGGAQARSVLWTSGDDGRSWTNRGEVCAQRGGEVDARAITTAADGSVVMVCRERSSGKQFVTVSTDDGASFRAAPSVLGAADVSVVGAASASTILVSSDDTYRSADGGRAFTRLDANAGDSPGRARYLGFSSEDEAHAISQDGRTIYTTQDAGLTWSAVRFQ